MDEHLTDIELDTFLDSAMEAEAARFVSAHLENCRGCARRLENRARLFEAIRTWEEVPIPSDLSDRIVTSLSPAPAPLGLRVATVLQAGVVVLIAALLWPLAETLLTSVRIPVGPIPIPGSFGVLVAQLSEPVLFAQTEVLNAVSALAATLRTAPGWIPAWPLLVAGGVAVFAVGNSILLRNPRERANGTRRV